MLSCTGYWFIGLLCDENNYTANCQELLILRVITCSFLIFLRAIKDHRYDKEPQPSNQLFNKLQIFFCIKIYTTIFFPLIGL